MKTPLYKGHLHLSRAMPLLYTFHLSEKEATDSEQETLKDETTQGEPAK